MVYEIMVAENSRATESLGGRAVVSKWVMCQQSGWSSYS